MFILFLFFKIMIIIFRHPRLKSSKAPDWEALLYYYLSDYESVFSLQ